MTDELGFCLSNKIIWDKGNSYTPESTTRRFHNAWEPMLWLVKDASEYSFAPGQVRVPYETDLVMDKRAPHHIRRYQVRELLKGVVEEDYLVLDPFCGQATTGIVVAELNCRFIGYDISQSFCRLSRRRLVGAYSV